MTSVQYLTKVGDVLNIQVEKVYGYDEWLQALDQGKDFLAYKLNFMYTYSIEQRKTLLTSRTIEGAFTNT